MFLSLLHCKKSCSWDPKIVSEIKKKRNNRLCIPKTLKNNLAPAAAAAFILYTLSKQQKKSKEFERTKLPAIVYSVGSKGTTTDNRRTNGRYSFVFVIYHNSRSGWVKNASRRTSDLFINSTSRFDRRICFTCIIIMM